MKIANLCHIIKDGKILLIRKKRGLGAGKINGPGGHMDEGESPEEGVTREVKEELKIQIKNPKYSGMLEFINDGKLAFLCYVFTTYEFEGEPTETDEAIPLWYDLDKIPYNEMWEDDVEWLPQVLSGKIVMGRFWFNNWKIDKRKIWFIDP
ncbi:MAG: 8-oxo-dGTP diphosphatase [Candidatus Altiarchaeota archaeon]|nr:8-oxo-dGTP diphosphatase [Candidatus Altiarchaeota archaeon]